MTQEEIRKFLIQYLSNKPMTQTELSKQLGINRVTLSNFLRGKSRLHTRVWKLLEKFIDMNFWH